MDASLRSAARETAPPSSRPPATSSSTTPGCHRAGPRPCPTPLRFTYDERGRVTSWTDTHDSRYEYAYDDYDRCVAEGHASLRLDCDAIDIETGLRVTTAIGGTGAVRPYVVNDACQIVKEIDPLGSVTHFKAFKVQANDGHVGKVDEATEEVGSSYMVVDTGPWSFGKEVPLPAGTVVRADVEEKEVQVNLTKDHDAPFRPPP
ncbi:RHS repeat domain-containing protein [Streptomyces sp. NPDC058646]|uniref:RHS repeat domain-containing protein n=1 Tax=Streptomyces sp. NPDC058646 TaxID=3346574 RepID=UPI0036625BBE